MKMKKVEFWVNKSDYEKILKNMERNSMTNLSQFMRILAVSDAEISFSVRRPTMMRVSDASLEPNMDEGREEMNHAHG